MAYWFNFWVSGPATAHFFRCFHHLKPALQPTSNKAKEGAEIGMAAAPREAGPLD